MSDADTLDQRLPKVAALLAEGWTGWRTVRLLIGRTDLVTEDELIAKVDRSLAVWIATWHGWSRPRIANAVDAAVRTVDPDATRERRVVAEDDPHIGSSVLRNGMAELYGRVVVSAATAFDRRLSQLAKHFRSSPSRCCGGPWDCRSASGRGIRRADSADCPTRASDREPSVIPVVSIHSLRELASGALMAIAQFPGAEGRAAEFARQAEGTKWVRT